MLNLNLHMISFGGIQTPKRNWANESVYDIRI